MSEPASAQPWWREPTRGQWASFVAAWLGWVMDAFDFTVFLLVMKQISEEFHTTATSTAGLIALTLLMRLLGGLTAGWAADRWGRKLPLMVSIVWFATCDGLVALAPSFTWVLVLRTLFGFGMGAEWTSGSTLAMENWPPRSRGLASGILQGSWAVGYLLAGVAAGLVVPHYGWRALFAIAAAPALLVFPIRLFVPESPEWLAGTTRRHAVPWSRIVAIPGLAKRLAWATGMLAAGFCGYYALTGNYSVMVQSALHGTMADVARAVALFNVGMLLGAALCGTAASRVGVGWAVAVPALAMALVSPLYVGLQPGLLWLGALLGGMFGAGYSGVTPLLLTGLFPPEVRARCVGLVYHLAAVPAAFVPMAIAAAAEARLAPLPWVMCAAVVVFEVVTAVLVAFTPAQRLDNDD